MARKLFPLMACVMCFALLAGCASIIPASPPEDLNPKVRSGSLVQKTNNFEMILDTSASMNTMHSWINICKSDQTPLTAMNPVMMRTTQLEYEQHLAQLFNDTIPDLKLTAGLRDFAGRRWLSRDYDTKLWYGMAPWVKTDLEKSDLCRQHLRGGKPSGQGPRCRHDGLKAARGQVGRDHLHGWSRNAAGRGVGEGDEGRVGGKCVHLRRADREDAPWGGEARPCSSRS